MLQGDLPEHVVPVRDMYARFVEHGQRIHDGISSIMPAITTLYLGLLLMSNIAAQPGAIGWLVRVNLRTGKLLQGDEWREYVDAVTEVCGLGWDWGS